MKRHIHKHTHTHVISKRYYNDNENTVNVRRKGFNP